MRSSFLFTFVVTAVNAGMTFAAPASEVSYYTSASTMMILLLITINRR